jgi:hypothetical protein
MSASDSIKNVLTGLLASIEQHNHDRYAAITDDPTIREAGEHVRELDVSGFYFKLLYPLSSAIDGLLNNELPGNPKAQFLFKHGNFVENHLCALFEKYEGSACSADKARTVIRRLLRFFTANVEIVFDYTAEYTYHLPKTILTTHAEIVAFFEALHRLYYGNAASYLKIMRDMEARLSADPAGEQSQS